jgi:2'-5' RNA ligase
MSSRESVGGGPYVVEEAWPLSARPVARAVAAPEAFRGLR